jgi:Neuraminidase (sialidase)
VRGTLLAFDEVRMYTCADNTAKDIVYKRSVDNGKTWFFLLDCFEYSTRFDHININEYYCSTFNS